MYHQRFKSVSERFSEKYTINPFSGCWEWKTGESYPRFYVAGKYCKGHRFAFEQKHGVKLGSNEHVLHLCDNPTCVNPDHLFLGDHKVNMSDRAAKGHYDLRGERYGRS
ncbi:HNH endonuclease signature motif containing protein [Corynebacterium diphtheriae]|uniref:HNH endonuclease signature motif containing protein n=1 Tax=Corynebacterium diphtheriae TaxID=1717 RepID=UPI000D06AE57|nr:HNH endonuclease signature motif containing protein [Corynebacterium diphtheriae]PSA69670.1 hypothetical protein BT092_11900 [Corynebacterium diphtheriae]